MALFGTQEWLDAFKSAINASTAYRESAKAWEGDFYFVVEPEPDSGDAPVLMYLDLWHGECRDARIVANESDMAPEFRIAGSASKWRKLIEQRVDPIKALMTNMLRIKGNMAKVVRNVRAAQDLVQCAYAVETTFTPAV
jgi:putative sterol carrier protein